MIREVLGRKCIGGPLISLHSSVGCAISVRVMESSSSSLRNVQHSQQQLGNNGMIGGSNLVGVRREVVHNDGRGVAHVGVPTNTAAPVSRSNTGSGRPAQARKASLGGPGSGSQNCQVAPVFQFGTVGLADDSLGATNSQTDFPLLSNVNKAQVSSVQRVTPGRDTEQLAQDHQGKDLPLARSLESTAPVVPMKLESANAPSEQLQVPQKRPSEPDLVSERTTPVRERLSKSLESKAPAPPAKVESANVPNEQSQVTQKHPSEAGSVSERPTSGWEGPSESLEQKASATPVKVESAIVPNEQAQAPQKLPSEPHLVSGRSTSGWDERIKENVPVAQPSPINDDEYPTLSASSTLAKGKHSRKGKSRASAEHVAYVYREPNEVKHRSEVDKGASVQGEQDREGKRNSNKSRIGYDDGMTGADRHGDKRRNGRQNFQDRDATAEKRDPIDSLGRTLTKILRHNAQQLSIKMSRDGYVDVEDLLQLPMKTWSNRPLSSHNVDDVKQVVKQDNKQRFGLKEENGRLLIRANQGHTLKSVESDHLLKPITSAKEVPVCVHGTYRQNLDLIFKEGLKRMSRNHVHFARGILGNDDVLSGMRKTSEVLIYLNVEKALADGMKLYISENGVILTEGFDGVIPPAYFDKVLGLPGMKHIAPPSLPC